jgi:hypothetical protein
MNLVCRLSLAVVILGFLGACEENNLRVDRVEPPEGINAGGDQINIIGAGFEPGKTQVRVLFGGHPVEQVVISSKNKITVVTPAADKGRVDVLLDFDNGKRFKIANGFSYVEPKQSGDVRNAFFNGKPGAK